MRKDRAARTLVVDDRTTYLWSVRHKHRDGDVCRDVLHLVLDGARTRIVFREGERGGVSGGYSYVGCVSTGPGKLLNLNEPGAVRHLIDEATDRGLLPGAAELDNWDLFDAVLTRQAAQAIACRAPEGGGLAGPQDQRPVRPRSRAVAAVPAVEVRSTVDPRT